MNNVLESWRINDIERKTDEAYRRLYEVSALTSDVHSLECTVRKLNADIDSLRIELQRSENKIVDIEYRVAVIEGAKE